MKKKTGLIALVALAAGISHASLVMIGIPNKNPNVAWTNFVVSGEAFPVSSTITVTDTDTGFSGTFDLVFGCSVDGALVGNDPARLGVNSPGVDASWDIEQGEDLYITVTNVSANISGISFVNLQTYQLDTTNTESVTIYDGSSAGTQTLTPNINLSQQEFTLDAGIQDVLLTGETYTLVSNNADTQWRLQYVSFDVTIPEAIPEPATTGLVLFGTVGLMVVRRLKG